MKKSAPPEVVEIANNEMIGSKAGNFELPSHYRRMILALRDQFSNATAPMNNNRDTFLNQTKETIREHLQQEHTEMAHKFGLADFVIDEGRLKARCFLCPLFIPIDIANRPHASVPGVNVINCSNYYRHSRLCIRKLIEENDKNKKPKI